MKQFFIKLFSDKNDINEKSIIGFTAFGIMTAFAVIDLVTGYLGKDLIINDFIYNSFLTVTLGALGIGSIDKLVNKRKRREREEEEEEELG